MIREYAVDPELMALWMKPKLFTIFAREFGKGSPRAMSGYPSGKKWEQMAKQAANAAGIEGKDLARLVELLRLRKENLIPRSSGKFDLGEDWQSQAQVEHSQDPFHAIMGTDNPNGCPEVISGSLEDMLAHDRWFIETRELCRRNAADVLRVVGEMLRLSRTVLFVDPYFHPGSLRYQQAITPLLLGLCGEGSRECSRVEILTNAKDSSKPLRTFVDVFRDEMPSRIPEGMQVRLRRLREVSGQEQLHDRFILTELGGVTLSVGLDQGDRGRHTQLFLMSRDQYHHWWSACEAQRGQFEDAEEVTVTGTLSRPGSIPPSSGL